MYSTSNMFLAASLSAGGATGLAPPPLGPLVLHRRRFVEPHTNWGKGEGMWEGERISASQAIE